MKGRCIVDWTSVSWGAGIGVLAVYGCGFSLDGQNDD